MRELTLSECKTAAGGNPTNQKLLSAHPVGVGAFLLGYVGTQILDWVVSAWGREVAAGNKSITEANLHILTETLATNCKDFIIVTSGQGSDFRMDASGCVVEKLPDNKKPVDADH